MAIQLEVLCNIDFEMNLMACDAEDIKNNPDFRKKLKSHIRKNLEDNLPESFPGEIGVFDQEKLNKSRVILGVTEPYTVQKIVATWNQVTCNILAAHLKNLETAMTENGYTSLSDFIKNALDEHGELKRIDGSMATWAGLADNFAAINDLFTYGQNRMVYTDGCRGTMIPEYLYKAIINKPENYAIVFLDYDL